MAFVLGNQDFQRIRGDREARALEAERINARNFAEDAQRLRRPNDPVNPQGQGLGSPMKPNQVGLTAAQAAAKAEAERLAAAEAAKVAAARRVTRFPTDANDPNSPNYAPPINVGLRPQADPSRVGTMNTPGITQNWDERDPDASRFEKFINQNPAPVQFQDRLREVDQRLLDNVNKGSISYGLGTEIFGRKPEREARADRKKVLTYFRQNRDFFRSNPNELIKLEANPIEYIRSRMASEATADVSGRPSPKIVPDAGVFVEPGPRSDAFSDAAGRGPNAVPTAAPTAHNAITFLESTNGTNIPKWRKDKTSSGVYGATDGTATNHGIPGVYVAKLKGLTRGSDEYNAEKDKAAAGVLDHYLGLYPNDPARVAMSYRFGTSAGKNWDGTEKGIRDRAKKVRGVKGDEAVRYVQTYVDRQSAPVTIADVNTTQVAADAPLGTEEIITVAGRRKREREIKAGVTLPGEKKSVAEEIVTASDLSNIKEPDIKMPFGLRTQELNTLMAQRRELKLQAISQLGRPGSAAALKANSDLSANGAMIQNMSQTQALNTLQISNDPRMLNQILNRQDPGANIRISPNSDGTFRVEMGGRIIADRKDKGLLISELRRRASIEYHKALNSAASIATTEAQKAALEFSFKIRELHTNRNYDVMVENMKLSGLFKGIENVFKRNNDGTYQVFLPSVSPLTKEIVYTWQSVPSDVAAKHQDAFKRSTK